MIMWHGGCEDDQFRKGYIAAVVNFTDPALVIEEQYQEALSLRKMLHEEEAKLHALQEQLSEVRVSAPCANCRQDTLIDYDLFLFTPETHWCGRTPRCCP